MSNEVDEVQLPGEELPIPEDSYKTPTPSSPDSLWTPTICSKSTEPCSVLRGDFEMLQYKSCPELTLAIIKPHVMRYADTIERMMKEDGNKIVQRRFVQLTPEQASNFYYDQYGEVHFPNLIMAMTEGPIKVFVLRRKDAVVMWKTKCGPKSIAEAKKLWPDSLRAIFGKVGEDHRDVCHASDSPEKALEEIRFFFPHMILDPNILDEVQVEDYLKDYVNPTLAEGLAQVCKNKPLDPVIWLAEWLLMNNPYKPKMNKEIMLTPT